LQPKNQGDRFGKIRGISESKRKKPLSSGLVKISRAPTLVDAMNFRMTLQLRKRLLPGTSEGREP
jgi:hypothetical protein